MPSQPPAPISRFALLWHAMPDSADRASHCDLLLEQGAVCLTWALQLSEAEIIALGKKDNRKVRPPIHARRLKDHRLLYLDYEGPIRGNRGSVACLVRGNCHWIEATDTKVRVRLSGSSLSTSQNWKSTLVLQQNESESGNEENGWTLRVESP